MGSPFFLSFLSGLFLAGAYPRFGFWFLAWVALVPLLASIRRIGSPRQAFGTGFLSGFVFFSISLQWLTEVTSFGWLFVAGLEAVFFGLFAWCVWYARSFRSLGFRLIWIAATWTTAEWLRGEIPILGFGWNLLAYSQSEDLRGIQIADLIGAYGVGFLIALWNVLAEEIIERARQAKKIWTRSGIFFLAILALLRLSSGLYGTLALRTSPAEISPPIAVIQGNIAQNIKWVAEAREKILEIHSTLTKLAWFDRPELVIWPEAVFPGYFNQDVLAGNLSALASEVGKPILFGSPRYETADKVYNSAYLIDREGQVSERHDKIKLVPFGEYIPFKWILGFLTPIADAMGVGHFEAGTEYTVFRGWTLPFGVLICFEDTFQDLARRFMQRGAQLLVVMTNDAWFGHSAAPYQHLQASVFRAIENRIGVVRSANTGISAFIAPSGKILAKVEDFEGRDIFVTGHRTQTVPLAGEQTFFNRFGYLFPQGVLIFFGLGLLRIRIARVKREVLLLLILPTIFLMSACVRVQGTAGYWHQEDTSGEFEGKQASFDTAKLSGAMGEG
ncbi:MAG: apolipoprotein N-acyltransferase [Candidatus Omnitrophota bacterium]